MELVRVDPEQRERDDVEKDVADTVSEAVGLEFSIWCVGNEMVEIYTIWRSFQKHCRVCWEYDSRYLGI